MKLNLGSGKDYREGYINIDKLERFKPDVLADIREIDYEENSVDEIIAQDVIDHITFMEAKALLRKCAKWLKPGGSINIHTPNMEVLGVAASRGNEEARKFLYGTAGEGNTAYETNIIRWCYRPVELREMLIFFGLKVIHFELTCGKFAFRMIGVKK